MCKLKDALFTDTALEAIDELLSADPEYDKWSDEYDKTVAKLYEDMKDENDYSRG